MLRHGKLTICALTIAMGLWATGVQAHPIGITAADVGSQFSFSLTCTIADQCDDDNSAFMRWTVSSFFFDGANTLVGFGIFIENTSNDPGEITTFSFNTAPDPAANALVSGSTIFIDAETNVGNGANTFDVCVANEEINNTCNEGDPQAGLEQGDSDSLSLLISFSGDVDLVTLSDWRARLQSTGLGQGSAKIHGQPNGFDEPENPIPEPGSMMLLGAGLAGLEARRRRRARKA